MQPSEQDKRHGQAIAAVRNFGSVLRPHLHCCCGLRAVLTRRGRHGRPLCPSPQRGVPWRKRCDCLRLLARPNLQWLDSSLWSVLRCARAGRRRATIQQHNSLDHCPELAKAAARCAAYYLSRSSGSSLRTIVPNGRDRTSCPSDINNGFKPPPTLVVTHECLDWGELVARS